jgi:hypothetical protein
MKSSFILLFVSGAALADDTALLHCRSVADGPARLACYNAIPVGVSAAAPVALPAAATVTPAAQQQVVYMPAAPAREDLERMFGKEPPAWKDARLKSIATRIDGNFDGWTGNQQIHLANGQVWKVVDGSDDQLDVSNPKVTVRRGLLGSIFLDIDGAHRMPKVLRVQ